MTANFYDKIDSKVKSLLDKPIPMLLTQENQILLQKLKETDGQKKMSKDLAPAKIGERYIANFLIIQGYKPIIINSDEVEFDLLMELNDKKIYFEVKTDFWAGRSANAAFELKMYRRKGAMYKTTADFIAYLHPKTDVMFFIKREKLLPLLKTEILNIIKRHLNDTLNYEELNKLDGFELVEKFESSLEEWCLNDKKELSRIQTQFGDVGADGIGLLLNFDTFITAENGFKVVKI